MLHTSAGDRQITIGGILTSASAVNSAGGYGFLIIIALITVFNIFNSMNVNVASRTKQYGIMRSIGMEAGQLYKITAAEAFTYAILGCAAGCILGLPLNRIMFRFLIADKWGIRWMIPIRSLLLVDFHQQICAYMVQNDSA